ncbi:A/G-specific adenine glycosylase [Rhodoflexus sp.]
MTTTFNFGSPLVDWYELHKRDLPWRATKDPYLIWLSEVILQQTRVAQGLPYYEKFVNRYPSVQELAAASEQEVLRLWQGLGYYSRARNMHATARMIAAQYAGKFPQSYAKLIGLKGIGPYTAAAIASFAFDEPVAVVDGNVYRVLSRLYGITEDIASHKGKQFFAQYAQELLLKNYPAVAPSIYNQAIMEFGATHCTPVAPSCNTCIFEQHCYARLHQMQQQLPVKEKKIKIKQRQFVYFLLEYDKHVLLKERGTGDIWQGLYDFPMVEIAERASDPLAQLIYTQIADLLPLQGLAIGNPVGDLPLRIKAISDKYKHQLTHQILQVQFVHLTVESTAFWQQLCATDVLKVHTFADLHELPKPVLIANYLQKVFF